MLKRFCTVEDSISHVFISYYRQLNWILLINKTLKSCPSYQTMKLTVIKLQLFSDSFVDNHLLQINSFEVNFEKVKMNKQFGASPQICEVANVAFTALLNTD